MYIDRVWQGEPGLGEVATARTTLQGQTWAFVSCANLVYRLVLGTTMFVYLRCLLLFRPTESAQNQSGSTTPRAKRATSRSAIGALSLLLRQILGYLWT